MASAGWFLERMPNCHLVGRDFLVGIDVMGSGLALAISAAARKFGLRERLVSALWSSVRFSLGGVSSNSGNGPFLGWPFM
jgi:hypothetical protein